MTEVIETILLFIREQYRGFGAVIKGYGINYAQYVALITLYIHGELSERDLATILSIDPTTVSRMVYALEKKGWVKGTRDEVDRRKVMIALTTEGKHKMEGVKRKMVEVVARHVALLDEEKRDFLYRAAEFVKQALNLMTPKDAIAAEGQDA